MTSVFLRFILYAMAIPQWESGAIFPSATPIRVGEPIRVAVDFQGSKIRPLAFVWGQKKYTIEKVNLVYKRRHGDGYQWCFAVSDAANSYVLLCDPEELRWTLEEVYTL